MHEWAEERGPRGLTWTCARCGERVPEGNVSRGGPPLPSFVTVRMTEEHGREELSCDDTVVREVLRS